MGTDLFIIWYYRYRQLTNRETAPLRSVHRLWLASPRQETDRSLQYPDAQRVEAGSVPAGFDRPARPLSEARRAQELLGKGGVIGKIVLVGKGASLEPGAAQSGSRGV